MADPYDIIAMMSDNNGEATVRAKALADAIRGQGHMATMLSAAGRGSPLGGMGETIGNQAKQATDLMHKAGMEKMRWGQEAQNLHWGTRLSMAQAMADARVQAAEEQSRARMYGSDNTLAGVLARIASGQGNAAAKDEKNVLAQFSKFADKYNPGISSSRNPFGLSGRTIVAANRLETLFDSQKKLDPQELRELAAGMAAMITSGQAGMSQRLIDELTPKTWKAGMANFLQFINNRPESAEAQAFGERFIRTAKRERENALRLQHQVIMNGALGYQSTLRHPSVRQASDSWFERAGMTPDMVAYIRGEGPPPDLATYGTNPTAAGSSAAASAGGGMIRVRQKSTGKTGRIPSSEFDPSQYEEIK